MEISGVIINVMEPRSGVSARSGSTWKTQEYVIETIESRPRHLCFEVYGEDKISQFNIQKGQVLKIYFDIDSREYSGRWYNQIRAWKIEKIGQ